MMWGNDQEEISNSEKLSVMAYIAQWTSISAIAKPPQLMLIILFPLLLLLGRLVVKAWWTPLRHVPGPFWAKFSRLWKLFEISRGSFEKTNIILHKRYGPIVRIADNEFSIDDPEAAKVIYGHGSQFVKSPWYYASGPVDPHFPSLFSSRDVAFHAATRRKVASSYSMTSLLRMEKYVDDCSAVFVQKLREFGKTHETLNMARWLQFYAFDVVGELTVGKRFGFLDEGKDVGGIISAIDTYLAYTANVGVYSEWHPFISSMMQKLSPRQGRGSMVEFTQAQIDKRKEDETSPHELDGTGDFLSIYLALHKKDPSSFTDQDLFAGCITNIGAGSDTTSISLSSVLYNLCKHPEALQKLREELEQKQANGELSNPVTFKESQACPYLQAVIKEALRVHPATGLPLGRVVPKGGATIAGTFFPEGAIVGINTWVAHMNASVFGHDAELFRPERWLTDKDNYNRMDRYFFTFGMGSRTCIGKNISLMEVGKVIPTLVQEFDFELVNPDADLKTRNVWFVKQQSFFCKVSERHSNSQTTAEK